MEPVKIFVRTFFDSSTTISHSSSLMITIKFIELDESSLIFKLFIADSFTDIAEILSERILSILFNCLSNKAT